MLNTSGIYRIRVTAPTGTSRFYIGQSVNILKRWKAHMRDLRLGSHWNAALQFDFTAYGEAAFSIEVVIRCRADKAILASHEQATVDAHRRDDLYNIKVQCVVSGLGVLASPERKSKIAAAIRGIKRSPETRAAIGRAQAWKKTPDGKAKLSASHQNRGPVSDVTKAKISASNMGRKISDETKAKRLATRQANIAARGFSEKQLAGFKSSAETQRGRGHSVEAMNALAAAGLARRGIPRPPDVCEKIRAALKGRKQSPEAIENSRKARIGLRPSAIALERQRLARIGTKRSDETKAKMRSSALAYVAHRRLGSEFYLAMGG